MRYKAFAETENGLKMYVGILHADDDYEAIEKAERLYYAATQVPYIALAAIWDKDTRFYTAQTVDDITET